MSKKHFMWKWCLVWLVLFQWQCDWCHKVISCVTIWR